MEPNRYDSIDSVDWRHRDVRTLTSNELRMAIHTYGMTAEDEQGREISFGAELYRRLPELAALWRAVEACQHADDEVALEQGAPQQASEPTRRVRALAEHAQVEALAEPHDVLSGPELGQRHRSLQATTRDLLASLQHLIQNEPDEATETRLVQRYHLDRGTIRRWRGKPRQRR